MLRVTLLTLTALLSAPAFAGTSMDDCTYKSEIAGATSVSRNFTVTYGCMITVTPVSKPELRYREYYFDERGGFTVFVSTPGDYETATGKRSYFLFPRKGIPDFSTFSDQDYFTLRLSSGEGASFAHADTWFMGMSGARILSDETGNLENHGGVEILSQSGILLDAGWKIGGAAYHDPGGRSAFHDPAGEKCEVRNYEIFDYEDAVYDEPLFKFQTDPELADFLSRRCPKLNVQSLRYQEKPS